jgi:hypothetical protein
LGESLLITGIFTKNQQEIIFKHADKSGFKTKCYALSLAQVKNWKSYSTLWVSKKEFEQFPFLEFVSNTVRVLLNEYELSEPINHPPEKMVYFDSKLKSLVGVQALQFLQNPQIPS